MRKKTSPRARPTIRKADGSYKQIDSRKLQALFIYNSLKCTQTELAKFFDVSLNTVNSWLKDAGEAVDDGKILEMAKARFHSFVPKALDVYDRALDIGRVFPKSEHISAAKDVLQEHKVVSDKSPTTTLNVNLIMEKRLAAQEAGFNAFGLSVNRLVATNGNRPADPSRN